MQFCRVNGVCVILDLAQQGLAQSNVELRMCMPKQRSAGRKQPRLLLVCFFAAGDLFVCSLWLGARPIRKF